MKQQRSIFPLGCLLFLLSILTACSATTINNGKAISWDTIQSFAVTSRSTDEWLLEKSIEKELVMMGFTPVTAAEQPDLLVSFAPTTTKDLNQESQRISRLKNLHFDFFQPGKQTPRTQIDYSFPIAGNLPDPEAAVKEIFAELKKQIGQSESTRQPAQVPTSKLADENNSTGSLETRVADQQSSPEAETQLEQADAAKPETSEAEKTSPLWMPRFKSWGIDNDDNGSSTDVY